MARLFHHGADDYETTIGRMADRLRTRFDATIKEGQEQCQAVLEQLDNERPHDRLIVSKDMKFVPTGNGVEVLMRVKKDKAQEAIHNHALQQMCAKGKMNLKYARQLLEMGNGAGTPEWAIELLAHNLDKLFHEGPGSDQRFLFRSVDSQVRGFLSDRYRRLDCRPLFAAFYEVAIKQAGAVPIRGYGLPTKVSVRVVLPTVFEPIPNQPMLYFLQWGDSDFGHGGHIVTAGIHQPWCTNEATRDNVLRQVHRGGRLADDFRYSDETYQLDQKTAVSALRDTIAGLLEPSYVDETMAIVKKAHDEKVDPKKVPQMLKTLRKGEIEQVVEEFTSADLENLSPGQNRWRLSNAISFVATKTEDKYRAIELERVAGRIAGLSTSRTAIEA